MRRVGGTSGFYEGSATFFRKNAAVKLMCLPLANQFPSLPFRTRSQTPRLTYAHTVANGGIDD